MGHPFPPDDPPADAERGTHAETCDRCREPGICFNEDGDFLCEDCMFEEAVEQSMPKIVAGEEPNF